MIELKEGPSFHWEALALIDFRLGGTRASAATRSRKDVAWRGAATTRGYGKTARNRAQAERGGCTARKRAWEIAQGKRTHRARKGRAASVGKRAAKAGERKVGTRTSRIEETTNAFRRKQTTTAATVHQKDFEWQKRSERFIYRTWKETHRVRTQPSPQPWESLRQTHRNLREGFRQTVRSVTPFQIRIQQVSFFKTISELLQQNSVI